ncbi:MAG: DUF2269 family protein [Candidatus Rokuibacteriota bacterium]
MTEFLLFLHILLAILLLGPLFLGHFVMPFALRRGRDLLPLARFLHVLESRVGPATLLIAVVGILLVEDIGFGYGDLWIWLSIVLVLVATVVGGALIGPTEKAAIAAVESGASPSALIVRVQLLGLVNVAILIAILWMMIDKPV